MLVLVLVLVSFFDGCEAIRGDPAGDGVRAPVAIDSTETAEVFWRFELLVGDSAVVAVVVVVLEWRRFFEVLLLGLATSLVLSCLLDDDDDDEDEDELSQKRSSEP